VIVMIWVYLLSVALLLGGDLNAVLVAGRRDGADPASGKPAPPGRGDATGLTTRLTCRA
jgi:uncharacterized BrkB/YihY/UPF0761 family membrane protein